MNVAYLVNQYPTVSHSFIRREIAGLEAEGVRVSRFSIRDTSGSLVDPEDEKELSRTRVILKAGAGRLLAGFCMAALTRPIRFARALALTLRIGCRSDRGLLRHFAYLAEACLMLKWLRESETEHVHAHFGTNAPTVAMLCRLLGGPPFSFTVHGPHAFDKPKFLAMREKIARAAFVVAVSSFGRSQLLRWCGHEDWPKVHVVHCGVDGKFLAEPETPLPPEARLVCVGRLCEQKGQLLLVEAAGRLADEGLDFELVLVGDGEMRPEIEKLIERLGLGERVRITGWATSDKVRNEILASRAMVLPSFAEGLPVVIMEALALGRPVISTFIAGIPELVEPDVCGWLVPAGSADALVPAMREALEAPVQRLQEMGRRGRERVIESHNARTEAARLAEMFRTARSNDEPGGDRNG